jgi:hypothetical protein
MVRMDGWSGWFVWVVSESKMPCKSSRYSLHLIMGDLQQFVHLKYCNNSEGLSPYCAIISGGILDPDSTLTSKWNQIIRDSLLGEISQCSNLQKIET